MAPKNYTYAKGRGYRVSKIINGRRIAFGDYETEDEAKLIVEELKKVDWNKDQLPHIRSKLGLADPIKNYEHVKDKGFHVYHKDKSYGWYDTEDEAKLIVEEMRRINWDKTQLNKIWQDNNIKGRINCKPKYYSYDKEKKLYEIKKGKTSYGYYDTEEMAKQIVEELKKVDWDKSKLDGIREYYNLPSLEPKYYYYDKSRDRYIARIKRKHIGSFATEEEAKAAVAKFKDRYLNEVN